MTEISSNPDQPALGRPSRPGLLARMFGGDRAAKAAAIYESLRLQARSPALFTTGGVPDTLDGRFETMAVLVVLAIRRLRRSRAERLARSLFACFMADMDAGLRELGVGDLSIAKQTKRITEALNGRLISYGGALDLPQGAGRAAALAEAVGRNLLGTLEAPEADSVVYLVAWIERLDCALLAMLDTVLTAGRLDWPTDL